MISKRPLTSVNSPPALDLSEDLMEKFRKAASESGEPNS
jgi:hypothetical protein